jgi:hypothetical protein
MRTKGKVSRASEMMTVARYFEPDMERQVKALLFVLDYAPKTTEGPGVWIPEPSHNDVTPPQQKDDIS